MSLFVILCKYFWFISILIRSQVRFFFLRIDTIITILILIQIQYNKQIKIVFYTRCETRSLSC